MRQKHTLFPRTRNTKSRGFTIVELLIVVVVIAILAAITVVAFNGISSRAKESALKTELKNGASQVGVVKSETGVYPINADNLKKSNDVTLSYSANGDEFCLGAASSQLEGKSFYVTQNGSIQEGECPVPGIAAGTAMQTVTTANCPTTRTRVTDARDNHTYWIQKLDDGRCWMLTNMGYAGGGTNTYGDTKSITLVTSYAPIATLPRYSIHDGTVGFTMEPSDPSATTNGIGQYGYYYNYCAAMGGQQGTSACSTTTQPAHNANVSLCPAGWRLPSGGSGSEFALLNNAVNAGRTNNNSGLLSNWLGRYSGAHGNVADNIGYYWSNGLQATNSAYILSFYATNVNPASAMSLVSMVPVRCIAM